MKRDMGTARAGRRLVMAAVLQIAIAIRAYPVDANGHGMAGQAGPVEPNFAVYYEPWESEVEPNAISYELPLDLTKLTNYDRVNQVLGLDHVQNLISRNGFVVIEHDFGQDDPNRDDIVSPYTYLRDRNLPMFVTADTLLHLYHVQFDETLKEVEEREFCGDIRALTNVLLSHAVQLHDQLEGDLREAARRNVAYLAVAARLIGLSSPAPAIVSDEVSGELAKIRAHAGLAESDIFVYREDYSQYVPRGHYTRSEILKRYFQTLVWYGRMAFLLKGHENWGPNEWNEALISPHDARIQTLQAFLLAVSLDAETVGSRPAREVWDRIYTVTAFYVGLADDLTPYDYLWALDQVFGQDFTLSDLDDVQRLRELKAELALLPSPQIFGGTGNIVAPPLTDEALNEVLDKTKGMRLMGQRFIPDSYMFQNLVYPQVGLYTGNLENLPFTSVRTLIGIIRGYPRGLDVMAILGSEPARDILIAEGDTAYEDYWERFDELQGQFKAFSHEGWSQNLYWGWLYSLQALVTTYGPGYPAFMQTSAWSTHSLHGALASWTELRHDTILHAKQSYTPQAPFSEKGSPTCYVEPVPEFFGRLLALTRMTRKGLDDMAVLPNRAKERLLSFEEMLNRLGEIAAKELTNQPLRPSDYAYLDHLGEELELMVTDVWDCGLKTTLVADVHTDSNEKKVLEEAVGKVDLIVVACPQADGSAFLATGPVLSYYEFKHPMADRLTDETWRELLDSPDKPQRPAWYRALTADAGPAFVVVDDFERYTEDKGNRIYETWIDGWTNGTGSIVWNGDLTWLPLTIVHGGRQSMWFYYDNADLPHYSEAYRTWYVAQDWTTHDTLTLYVHGHTDNDGDSLYVGLEDMASRTTAVVVHPDPNVILTGTWSEWEIPLSDFRSVNHTGVTRMYIGVGNRDDPQSGGTGRICIDDIRLMKRMP